MSEYVFEALYSLGSVQRKHLEAPLLFQRTQYLDHLLRLGVGRIEVRTTANYLLHVIRFLKLTTLRTVYESEILLAGRAWAEYSGPFRAKRPVRGAPGKFVEEAKRWFRFHGSLASLPTSPFEQLASNFSQAMRIARGLSPASVVGYSEKIRRFLLWLSTQNDDFAKVSIHDVDSYMAMKRSEGCKPRSLAANCQALRTFFGYAETQQWCKAGVGAGIKSPSVPRFDSIKNGLRWDQVRKLLRATDGDGRLQLRSKAILMLLTTYGLRSCEVSGLRLVDFDWRSEVLTVRRAKRGGTQQFPIQYKAGEAVLAYLQRGRPRSTSRYVFLSMVRPYDRINAATMWTTVSQAIRKLGVEVPHMGPHALRHACATRLLQKGCSLQGIAEFLGHRDIKNVGIYARFDMNSLCKVAAFSLGGLR